MTNKQLLEAAGAAIEGLGVQKTEQVITTDNQAQGDFMNRAQVERLVDLTVSQSDWLSAMSLRIRKQRAGQIPRVALNEIVTEGADENDGESPTTVPTPSGVEYFARKFHTTYFLTREDMREAAASGEPDYENKIRLAFAKAMGNDMALAALLGDTTLAPTSRRNRLLRRIDGWLKRVRADSHRGTTTYGSAFDAGVFDAILDLMPQEFAEDANLRWFMARKIDQSFTKGLRDLGAGSDLKERTTVERTRFAPCGIPQIIVPQMPTTLGFATLSGSAVDPDLVTAPGGGIIVLRVDSLFGGYSASNAGRRVTVTRTSTGQSETLTVTNSSSHNIITTAGNLGQSSISTTATDYTIDVADCTPIILANPANFFLVLCDEIRAYRKVEQEFERIRIDVFWEGDTGVFNADAVAMYDGVVPTRFTWGS